MVADRGGFTGLTMPNVTPFFEFVLAVVVTGSLLIVLATLLWSAKRRA